MISALWLLEVEGASEEFNRAKPGTRISPEARKRESCGELWEGKWLSPRDLFGVSGRVAQTLQIAKTDEEERSPRNS